MDVGTASLGGCVTVGTGDTLGAVVVGRPMELVGDAEIALGKPVEPKIGSVGSSDTVGNTDKVGRPLDKGPNVGFPTVVVGTDDTLGC